MCQTKLMRPALIFLVCLAGFVQAGVAQAPGTLDPSKDPSVSKPAVTQPGTTAPLLPPPVSMRPAPAGSPPAGSTPTSSTRDADTIVVNANVVIAPTTVRDRNGEFVNGLQLQDFELYDDGKLQKVNADVRDEPLSLVVAVQRSSNLTEFLPKLQRVGTELNQLVAGP